MNLEKFYGEGFLWLSNIHYDFSDSSHIFQGDHTDILIGGTTHLPFTFRNKIMVKILQLKIRKLLVTFFRPSLDWQPPRSCNEEK